MMITGENEHGLRKVLDLTRLMSIVVLLLHFYYVGYDAFSQWQLTSKFTDRILSNIDKTGLFQPFHKARSRRTRDDCNRFHRDYLSLSSR